MLFRQKEKVPDIGKHNFRDFFRGEEVSCQQTQNKMPHLAQSMKLKHSLSNTSSVVDGSLKMVGSTFDAHHMGTFLQKSKFASTGTRAMKISEPFQSSDKNQSFFFRNQQPRMLQDNIDYLHLTKLNHIVAEHPVNDNQEYLKKRMLQVPDKSFNEEKLQYQSDPQLKFPSQYLADMKEAKEHQQKYKEWRNSYQDVNRAFRKAKMGYKSGLYTLDTPYTEGTELYQEEHAKIKEQEERKQKINKNRFIGIEKFNASNPSIEFNNVKHAQNIPNIEDQLLKTKVFPQTNYELKEDWMRKAGNQSLDTKTRLFGAPSEMHSNPARAQYLKDQELRGRDYNAISLTKF